MPNYDGKTCSYGSFYSEFDQDTMGYLYMWTYERYLPNVNMVKFSDIFMKSKLRYIMEDATNPRISNSSSEEILDYLIDVDLEGNRKIFGKDRKQSYHYGELQWIGMAYAYLHYNGDIRSRDLNLIMPFTYMRYCYITGHQLFFSGFYDRCKWMIEEFKDLNHINYESETYEKYKTRKIPERIQKLLDEYR